MEEETHKANARAFAKYVKQAPRPKRVHKKMTGVWLPKLGSKSIQQDFTRDADSQETLTLGLFD